MVERLDVLAVTCPRCRALAPRFPRSRSVAVEPLESRTLFSVAGTLDPTFGVGGQIVVKVGGSAAGARGLNLVRNSAAQPDGKIVLVGASNNPAAGPGALEVAVARLNADGTSDVTFGGNGLVFIPSPTDGTNTDYASGVSIDANGDIVVSATFSTITNGVTTTDQFAVARLLPNGAPDPAFGGAAAHGTGIVFANFPAAAGTSQPLAEAHAVAVQPDGKIVAAGVAGINPSTGASDIGLARFNADGTPDAGFGTGGAVAATLSGNAEAAYNLTLQPDGKILVAGTDYPAGATAAPAGAGRASFLVARFNADGSADPSFGKGGLVTTSFARGGRTSSMSAAAAVAVSDDGTVYAGGLNVSTDAKGNQTANFALALYHPNGTANKRFGRTGNTQTPFGQFASVNHVTILPTDGVVVSGIAAASAQDQASGNFSSLVAEYTSKGVLNPFFGNKGSVRLQPKTTTASRVPVSSTATAPRAGGAPSRLATADLLLSTFGPSAAGRSLVALAGSSNTFEQFQRVEKLDAAIAIALNNAAFVVGSSGNQIIAARLINTGPDVSITSIGGVKSSSILGASKGAVSVVVSNQGDQPLVGPVTLTLSLSAVPAGQTGQTSATDTTLASLAPVLKLQPAQRKTFKFAFNFPSNQPAGAYVLTARAQPGSTMDTLSTDNAASTAPPFTLAPAFVDLNGAFVALPASLAPGQKTAVTLTIKNAGNVPAKGLATIALVASPDQTPADGTALTVLKPVGLSLKPGASRSLKVAALVPAGLPAGSDFLIATVSAPALNDTNLANNTFVSPMPVGVT